VEQLRDTVGNTATELKTIVSPAHIKKEIRNYVREERESVLQSIQQRAKDNPLQMAAIGAAVAYPALSLLRAIPTPLLLIGAGLFLTSKRGQQSANDIKAKVDDVVQQGTEKVSELAGAVRSDLEDRIAGARYGVEELRDTVTSATGSVTSKVTTAASAMTDKAQSAIRHAADTASDAVGNAKDSAKNAFHAVTGQVAQAASSAQDFVNAAGESAAVSKDQAAATAARSRDGIINFVNDNALLVAGIGAAVGAFIAASIPSSEAENKLFGSGSEKLKNKAREAAAQSIEAAGNIAADAAGSVATAAAHEGLDAVGIQTALNTVADSVRKVADRGLETALGAKPQSEHQSTTQRNAL
jgi:hypothetical protein